MRKGLFLLLVFVSILYSPSRIMAVEPAPRISDREIVERLTRLEKRFDAMEIRFDKRIEDLRSDMNGRFNDLRSDMNGRFNDLRSDMNARFDTLQWILGLFVTITLVILGFVLRMQWQIQKRQTHTETALETTKDEIDFLKGAYLKLQDLVTSLLKPPRGAL